MRYYSSTLFQKNLKQERYLKIKQLKKYAIR